MSALKLFSWRFCPYAQRTRIMLWLKKIPCELIELDLTRPLPTWFRVLNPDGRVPALMHEGRMICDSDVLGEYLEEAFADMPLLPEAPYDRALSRSMINHGNRRFIPAFYQLLLNQNCAREGELRERTLRAWRWLNDFLAWHNEGGDFLFQQPTLADFSLAPFVQRYPVVRYYRGVRIPSTNAYHRVLRWRDALLALPVVQATGLSEDDFIKVYEDYALGYENAEVPAGRERSSFDLTLPLEQRPMPPRPEQG